MAFVDFYMQTTGDNLNSGSTNADAASYTSTGGNFDGTSVFTPTDGSTPASSISVGDYVSLYNTGDTFPRCIAKVTAVGGGVNGTVTIDTTIKYGTVPTVNSGSRNIKMGGAWASLAATATNGFLNTGTCPQPTIFNIKKGTYANTTTNRTINMTGTATSPYWVRGYDTTPGDCDTDLTKERPVISFTTGVFTPSTNSIWSSLNITSAASAATVTTGNITFNAFRCQFLNTGTSTSSIGITANGAGVVIQDCYISTASTSNLAMNHGSNGKVIRCTMRAAGGGAFSSNGTPTLIDCNLSSVSNVGINLPTNGASFFVSGCTIRGCGSHGIAVGGAAATPAAGSAIVDCVITNNGGSGIRYNNATATNNVFRSGNTFYGNSSGEETWVGDHPNLYKITEPSDPLPNAGSGDFALTSGASGRAVSWPFEGLASTTSYADRGAIQHQDSGGGAVNRGIMTGGRI